MLLFLPMYRHPERMTRPINLGEAEALGVNPVYAAASDMWWMSKHRPGNGSQSMILG
jgi:hypothetical protein